MSATSVQCEIAKEVKDIFKPAGDEFYLHAAGREDIDVRMLGTGRPFIFEFVNPRRAYTPHNQIENVSVNSKSVKVKDFKIVDKEFFERMKEIESQKAKRYSAVVWLSRQITDEDCQKLNSLRAIKLA